MNNYNKTQNTPYDPTKLGVHSFLRSEADLISKCGLISKKKKYFDAIVHLIDEENIVTWVDFGCGITFITENPTNVGQTNGQRENICRSCKKTECIPSNNQNNCSFDE